MPNTHGALTIQPDPLLRASYQQHGAPLPSREAARVEVDGRLVILLVANDLSTLYAFPVGGTGFARASLAPLLGELGRQAVEGIPRRFRATHAEREAARDILHLDSGLALEQDIAVDDDAAVSEAGDAVWVQTWLRVPRDRIRGDAPSSHEEK